MIVMHVCKHVYKVFKLICDQGNKNKGYKAQIYISMTNVKKHKNIQQLLDLCK